MISWYDKDPPDRYEWNYYEVDRTIMSPPQTGKLTPEEVRQAVELFKKYRGNL